MIRTSGKFRAAIARLKAPTLRRQRRVPITCECSHLYSLPVARNAPVAKRTSSATGWRLTSCLFSGYSRTTTNPRGILLGILGGSVPPGSSNPDPLYDQKISSSTPVFRPDLKNPYPFSDLAWPLGGNYVIITWIRA